LIGESLTKRGVQAGAGLSRAADPGVDRKATTAAVPAKISIRPVGADNCQYYR
jgi:hypothetical protein